jgi:hypothetical protein
MKGFFVFYLGGTNWLEAFVNKQALAGKIKQHQNQHDEIG